LLLVPGQLLFPQNKEDDQRLGDRFTLKVAVMGPGDALYFWWGHIALIIEDTFTGKARFYDYGLFSFDTDHFFVNFAFGRLLYSCGASPAEQNFRVYSNTNRDILLYTLDLPAASKEAVWRFAETNILPENRNYYYHHFRDNCATRIRDIIDLAVDGQFKERFGQAPGRYTFRQHVRRHTWFSPFADWMLNFLMGQDIDTPITIWQEMFLPAEIGKRIADFRYIDAFGVERALVSSQEILNKAVKRPAVLDVPRRQWDRELVLGIGITLVLIGSRFFQKKQPVVYQVLWGGIQSILGFVFGIAGLLLFFMTFFTNHDYTYHNSNLLYINPLVLGVIPLSIIFMVTKNAKKRGAADRLLKALWTYIFFGCILSIIITVLPMFYQQNQVTQALVLPFALVLSFVPDWIGKIMKMVRKN
jgi:hypothetical protein